MKHIHRLTTATLALLCVTWAATPAFAQHEDHGKQPASGADAKQEKSEFAGDPYLLDVDPVTGEKLGPVADQIIFQHEGRELRFANEKNQKAFVADPAKYLPELDKKMISQQLPYYPLKTCPVSGKELGEMGEPRQIIVRNRLVQLCCNGCEKKLFADTGKYVAALDAAVVAEQMPKYALEVCAVSGEEFGGEMGDPIPFVAGNRLVKLCCKSCIKKIRKDPLAFYGKLDKAVALKAKEAAAAIPKN